MLIREVILENFMSYEYARIPLRKGLNVISGPNGAGKSSILLAISIALGQTYTERARKLSDLIRRGKDLARVTLVLDNSRKGRRRPVARINKDYILLSRFLRRDGKYWFEIEGKAATKDDVLRLLSKFRVDPDNMLIIMHQGMVERFIALSPQEKLKMVEEAVGLEAYRRNVVEAQKKLSRILSEEDAVGKLLESAEQTLRYWREQYDKYQQKKQLLLKRRLLERELAWAKAAEIERRIQRLEEKAWKLEKEKLSLEDKINAIQTTIKALLIRLGNLKLEQNKILEERVSLERDAAICENGILQAEKDVQELERWRETRISEAEKLLESFPSRRDSQFGELKIAYRKMVNRWSNWIGVKTESLKGRKEHFTIRLKQINDDLSRIQEENEKLESESEKLTEEVIGDRIKAALFEFQKDLLEKDMEQLTRDRASLNIELKEAERKAEEKGARLVPMKKPEEIEDELRVTTGQLLSLADVSEDIEKMYESYSTLYMELKEKAQKVAENRRKAMEEVQARMESWKSVIKNLLEKVTLKYQRILFNAQADGEIRLINENEIELAGLEILVGFKGVKPVPLDAYTQSGGERATATMAFLIALQQHIRSPFRAVDEYDVHMDPRNREVIANLLLSSIEGSDTQYVAITPSQLTFTGKAIHLITVQNVDGASIVRERM